jgi:lipopolysaccharide biosynthesis regulator YciM
MNVGEQPLLVILVALVAGIAIGRFWSGGLWWNRSERRRSGPASIHYILGLDFLASRQIDRAVSELTLAARENTEAIEIYLILGNLLREKGQIERAIQIHQSILHRPDISPSERAHALLCLGMDFKKAGLRNRAMETLQKVVELEPKNAYALKTLVKIYEEEHDWEQALRMEEKLSGATGESDSTLRAFLFDQIGQAAWQAEAGARAARCFDDAIRAEPRLPPPYIHYGDMLEEQGQLEQAEARWLSLATEHPRFAYLVFDRLERVREKLNRSGNMEELYQLVIDRDDKDSHAHLALARLRAAAGAHDEAFKLELQAVRANPHALAVHLEVWKSIAKSSERSDWISSYLEEVSASAYFLDPYVCIKCNYRANGILWRCPHCQEWDTFVEERVELVEP